MEETEHTIFAADNNENDRHLLKMAFEETHLPFKIVFAEDGNKLLKNLEEYYDKNQAFPRMILLDLNMKNLHSLETLAAIKSHFLYRAIPVLVLSSDITDRYVIKAYSLGANSFIVKPATKKEFEEFVSTLNRYWFEYTTLPKDVV